MKSYFTESELACKCCGENLFNAETLERLNSLRGFLDFPFIISSGYRCESYNEKKGYTQTHATGQAVDIVVSRKQAFDIVTHAADFLFTGIGIKQHGAKRFIHLDDLNATDKRPRPTIWSYK